MPRTGPAAMPSPRSKHAPYFSGHRGTFEDFLEEFEARAYDCRLTDPQRVDTLVCYVDSAFRDMCKSLNGYRLCDWSLFRHSLINAFGIITPRHQIMKQKLYKFAEDSSRMRMYREDDVLQYYRTFQHFSNPLIHSGYLTEKDRDIEFWYGFHPHDRDVIWPRLLDLYPFQPHDIPFHFERIFDCACRAFAYVERLSSWPREQELERPRLPRYPSSSYTSDPRPFPSYSESQHTPAPSVMKVQPEPEPKLMPSITPTSPSAPSLASSCMNVVPKSQPEPNSNIPTSSPLLPTTSLASSCTANVAPDSKSDNIPSITSTSLPHTSSCTAIYPEPESISEHAFSSVFPSTSPVLSIPSISASCTDAVTEPEPESLLYSTPSCHIDVPEPECTLSTLPMSTSPAPSSANDDFENMPTQSFPSTLAPSPSFSNSFTELECSLFSARSATKVQLPELASPLSTSTYSSTGAHPIPNVVEVPEIATVVPELELALIPDNFAVSFPSHSSSLLPSEFVGQLSVSCIHESTPGSAIGLFSLGLSESSSESRETIPILHPPESPLKVSNVPVLPHSTSQARSQERTFEVTLHEVTPEVTSTPPFRASALEVSPSLSDHSHASPSRALSTVEISRSRFDPKSSRGENVPIHPTPLLDASLNITGHSSALMQDRSLSVSFEESLNVPAPPHSTPPQRPLGVKPVDSDSFPREVRPAPASSTTASILRQRPFEDTQQVSNTQQQSYLVPQQLELQDLSPVYEASSTLAPRLHFSSSSSFFSSSPRSARLDFPFVFVTTAVRFSSLVVSKTVSTLTRRSWAKNEDVNSNDRNRDNTTMPGNAFDVAQLFQLGKYLPTSPLFLLPPPSPGVGLAS
jgi:hypothetical protein